MYKVFHAVFKKFLTVIDHIDYHPSQKQNTTRIKEVTCIVYMDNTVPN